MCCIMLQFGAMCVTVSVLISIINICICGKSVKLRPKYRKFHFTGPVKLQTFFTVKGCIQDLFNKSKWADLMHILMQIFMSMMTFFFLGLMIPAQFFS